MIVDSIKRYKKTSSSIDITTSGNFSTTMHIENLLQTIFIVNYNDLMKNPLKRIFYPQPMPYDTNILNLSLLKFKDTDEKNLPTQKYIKTLQGQLIFILQI